MPELMTSDKKVQIRADSITVDWDLLTGVAAGGEGIDVTEYEIAFRQILLDSAGVEASEVAGTAGTETVAGSLNKWRHASGVDNAETWAYKIRAANAVCPAPADSAWSREVQITSGAAPKKPDPPRVCVEDMSSAPGDLYTVDRLRCLTRRMRLMGPL